MKRLRNVLRIHLLGWLLGLAAAKQVWLVVTKEIGLVE